MKGERGDHLFGRTFRAWRRKQPGWLDTRLAEAMGCNVNFIRLVETSRRAPFTPDRIQQICEIMGVPEMVGYWLELAAWDRMLRAMPPQAVEVRPFLEALGERYARGILRCGDITRLTEALAQP